MLKKGEMLKSHCQMELFTIHVLKEFKENRRKSMR